MNIKLKYSAFACLLLALFISSCARTEVKSTDESSLALSKLWTYEWAPVKKTARLEGISVDSDIKRGVERQLNNKGYLRQPAGGTADFLIKYDFTMRDTKKVTTLSDRYDYGTHVNRSAEPEFATVHELREGMLSLEIIDQQTKQRLWQGTAQTKVYRTASREHNIDEISRAIRQMMVRFPEMALDK